MAFIALGFSSAGCPIAGHFSVGVLVNSRPTASGAAPLGQHAMRKVYVPAIAIFSIKIEPVVLLPRVMVSAPTATI